MKKTVNEMMKLTGISVRTLHYYDEIGLLKPCETTEAGYRLYNEQDLERLQQILFFRELHFPLKRIQTILDNPAFDKRKALENHKELLLLEHSRLTDLIRLVDTILKGESNMSFQEFDTSEIESAQKKYGKEAEERWGNTDAYAASQKKTSAYGKNEWAAITAEAEVIYQKFAAHMHLSPSAPEVQQLAADWQAHITTHYYTCTKEILAGLGAMYVGDKRFQENIDRHPHDAALGSLAEFMSKAIAVYCQ
jgi:DNA-binding transcriptional MerR regulator